MHNIRWLLDHGADPAIDLARRRDFLLDAVQLKTDYHGIQDWLSKEYTDTPELVEMLVAAKADLDFEVIERVILNLPRKDDADEHSGTFLLIFHKLKDKLN